jgi:hypothetical protein
VRASLSGVRAPRFCLRPHLPPMRPLDSFIEIHLTFTHAMSAYSINGG